MTKTKKRTWAEKANSPDYSACAHCTAWVHKSEGVRANNRRGEEEVFCSGKCSMDFFNNGD